MLPAGGPDADFYVLARSRVELREASDREVTRAISRQQRGLRLAHPAG
jgi:hypothetical protein